MGGIQKSKRQLFGMSRANRGRVLRLCAGHLAGDLILEPLERRLMLTVPAVVSIERDTPTEQVTNASEVSFVVTFSETVTGVGSADFELTTSGSAAATTPVSVSGSGAVYTVTIDDVRGNGDLRLDVADDDSIINGTSVPLGGSGAGNGDFTAGEVYSLDHEVPAILSISRTTPSGSTTNASLVTFTATFSEDVTGVDPSDFALVRTGTVASTMVQVTPVSGSEYDVTVVGVTGSGSLGLNLVDDGSISDLAGNGFLPAGGIASFDAETTVAAGYPLKTVAADVNGDEHLDLIAMNTGDNSLGVLLGYGDGTFQSQVTYAVGANPTSLAVADVNGDDHPDIIVTNGDDDTVSVLLGDSSGDGTFPSEATYATGDFPISAAIADVDGDGHPDLIVANAFDGSVSVLLGDGSGDGTFPSSATYGAGVFPGAVTVADVDEDGHPDLIVANPLDDIVTVLLGDDSGDGSFPTQATYATGAGPVAIAVGDLNGDGHCDLAIADSLDNDVTVLLGNGDGTFGGSTTFAAGATPASIALADLNADDKLDLIVGNASSHNLIVYAGDGSGEFAAPVTYATGSGSIDTGPYSVAVADLDEDDHPDLVVSNGADDTVGILLNEGLIFVYPEFVGAAYTIDHVGPSVTSINRANADDPAPNVPSVSFTVTFAEAVTGVDMTDFAVVTTGAISAVAPVFSGSGSIYTVTIGVTGGGTLELDLVDDGSIRDAGGNPLTALGPASFDAETTVAAGYPLKTVAADVNGDEHLDLIAMNTGDNSLGVLLGYGDGTFQSQVTYAVGANPTSLAVADVNGDDHPDIIVTNGDDDTVSVLLGDSSGDGTFPSEATYATGDFPISAAIADVDGDGHPDLIVANAFDGSVSVLLGDGSGDGTFPSSATYGAGVFPGAVTVADVDEDGHPDLIVANPLDDIVTVLLGDDSGDGSFPTQATYATGAGPVAIAVGDLNGDGHCDLAIADSLDNDVTVLLGNGDGTFGGSTTFAAGATPASIALADLNADDKLDLIVGNASSHNLIVYAGDGSGGFAAPVTYATGSGSIDTGPYSVAVADLDEDDHPDLVVSNGADDTVGILLNDMVGDATGQAYSIAHASVVGRWLFYDDSAFDSVSDDDAIATDKFAYLPNAGPATFADVSSYDKGLNGIMIDINGTQSTPSITLADVLDDFTFQVGNNNSPSSWSNAPSPSTVTVRAGAGTNGSDRVELIWGMDAPTNTWLKVTVKATANTGLFAEDVFYFGHETADSGFGNSTEVATTTEEDETGAANHHTTGVAITNRYDFNRDGDVDSDDEDLADNNPTNSSTGLKFIVLELPGAGTSEAVVVSGVTISDTIVLLSDGSVMSPGESNNAATTFRLIPDASGNYLYSSSMSTPAMSEARYLFVTITLQDGRLMVVGGRTIQPSLVEIYDPVTNIWSSGENAPEAGSGESTGSILPDGTVLVGAQGSYNTFIYDSVNDEWSETAHEQVNHDAVQEQYWTKLPDGSLVTYLTHYEVGGEYLGARFHPGLNEWAATGEVPVRLQSPGSEIELGGSTLLPDGRVFAIGSTYGSLDAHTAFYDYVNDEWTAGPDVPEDYNSYEQSAAVLPNGHVLFAVVPTATMMDFDPLMNTFSVTEIPALSVLSGAFMLPNGQLLTNSGYLYTPEGLPDPSWRPTVSHVTGVTDEGSTTYTLTGTQLTGITGGGVWGNGNQDSTGYPIIRVRNQSGTAYAHSFNWSTSAIATGDTPESVQFTLPDGFDTGELLLSVITNGIASFEVPFFPDGEANPVFDVDNDPTEAHDDEGDFVVRKADSFIEILVNGSLVSTLPISETETITIVTATADDSVLIDHSYGGAISIPITVVGSGGTLTIDDDSNSAATTYTIDGDSVASAGMTISYSGDWSEISLETGTSSSDQVDIESTSEPITIIAGGTGQAIDVGDASHDLSGIDASVQIDGDASVVVIHNEADSTATDLLLSDSSLVNSDAPSAAIGYSGVASLTVQLGSGTDTLAIASLSASSTSITATSGSHTFTNDAEDVEGLDDWDHTLNITDSSGNGELILTDSDSIGADYTYTLTGNTGTGHTTLTRAGSVSIDYHGLALLQLTGSIGDDVFSVSKPTSVATELRGGSGADLYEILATAASKSLSIDDFSPDGNELNVGNASDALDDILGTLDLSLLWAASTLNDQGTSGAHEYAFTSGYGLTRSQSATLQVSINFDGSRGSLTLHTNNSTNTFDFSGVALNTTVNSGSGVDTMIIDEDVLSFGLTLNAGDGADEVTLKASTGVVEINGEGGNDTITIGDDSDTLDGILPSLGKNTGEGPFSVAVADVNEDGIPDLVIANGFDNNVGVLLGNGNGTFQNQATYATGSVPVNVVAADVNGDSHSDLIVANYADANIGVLLGNGDGTFDSQVTYAVGSGPAGIGVADVNDDGKPDLIVSNHFDNTVSVLLGHSSGNGTFLSQTTFATGAGPFSIVLADVDEDDALDLIIANPDDDSLSVLIGNGNGTFDSQVTYATGDSPGYVVAADVDDDDHIDLIVSNSGDNNVGVLLGDGDGTFDAQTTFATGAGPSSIVVADVDGDDAPDVIVVNSPDNTVSVLLGNGNGTFQSQMTFATGVNPYSLALADMNGDGKLDLIVTNLDDNDLNVLLGDGQGAFGDHTVTVDGGSGSNTLIINDEGSEGQSFDDDEVAGLMTRVDIGSGVSRKIKYSNVTTKDVNLANGE